jgi:DNA-binding HxlR family transcriptional regulator
MQRARTRPAKAARKAPPGRLIFANSGARAMVQVGDRWSLLILGAAFGGVHRFTDWLAQIGIASNILANRLAQLVASGCLERLPADSGKRIVYRLTEKGRDLYPVALMFRRFDRAWSKRRPSRSGTLVHRLCGEVTTPTLICAHCRAPVYARDVEYADGPGAGMERTPPPSSNRRSSIPPGEGAAMNALFGESIDIFGDRWTQLIVGMFFLGQRRFEDIRAKCQIATNILSDRLKLLVEHGILQKRIYQANPERSEYLLTPKGMDIYPIMVTLTRWGDRWLAKQGRPPLLLTHRNCRKRLDALAVCSHCEQPLACHDVSFTGGRTR